MFIRIEPSSSVPIYRQIMDQLRYQIASGVLKEGDRLPGVRELAARLAVNQNTILKVYTELGRENILVVERGDGTFVSSARPKISSAQKLKVLEGPLREAAVQAVQSDIPIDQAISLFEKEYDAIKSSKKKEE